MAHFPSPAQRNWLNFFWLVLGLCGFVHLAAAQEKIGTPGPEPVRDRRGHEIVLAKPPQQIIALGPSLSQTVWALGAGDRMVGRSRYCTFPEELKGIEEVGGIVDPNLEIMLSLQPDLVLGLEFLPEQTAKTLENAGIPVALFDFSTYEQVRASMLSVARLLGTPEDLLKAAELHEKWGNALAEPGKLIAGQSGGRKLRTLLTFDPDQLFSAGGASYIGEILRALHTENLADQSASAWPELARESALEFDPEAIVVLIGPSDFAAVSKKVAKWRNDPYWSQLSAVKSGRVAVLANPPLVVPGPRLEEGVRNLCAALYPDLYPQLRDELVAAGGLALPLQRADGASKAR